MTAITINIPNHEVSFFKKMMAKMGWTYSEADVVRSEATRKEKTLAKVDHAFGQLRQMKDGQLEGINAEDLLNEPLTKCQTLCELRPAPVWNIYKRWKESDYQVITLSRSWDRSLKGLANKKCEVQKLN